MRKKILVPVAAVGAGVLGLGIFATTLTLNDSSGLAAGSQAVAAGCDSTFSTQTDAPTWSSALDGWVSAGVTVSGVDATACLGKTLKVVVLDASNAQIGDVGTAVVTTGVTSYNIEFEDATVATPVVATDIEKVATSIR